MREGRPSQTASFVALARALANDGFTTVPGFSDPFAARLLSPGWSRAYRAISRRARRARPDVRARAVSQLDIVPLRVAAIDRALEAAVSSGCRQVVLLGAGLDTRAFRMSALAGARVFEVDHPATQAYKRRRAAELQPLAGSLTFVAVDFEHSPLAARLGETAFRTDVPTAWVWEGVVMYLTEEAVRRTLDDIARLSMSGSELFVHYHEPYAARSDRENRIRRALLWFWREPQIGQRTADVMQALVKAAGFDVVSDTRAADWARELGAQPPTGETANVSRLLAASRG
jgi:methyltransferase (TIGR00027 family)